jgi:hypothetical protein
MSDIHGQRFEPGGLCLLLCQVLEIETGEPAYLRIRVLNSEHELAVGAKHDEALGGLVADSELTAFDPMLAAKGVGTDDQADGVKLSAFE